MFAVSFTFDRPCCSRCPFIPFIAHRAPPSVLMPRAHGQSWAYHRLYRPIPSQDTLLVCGIKSTCLETILCPHRRMESLRIREQERRAGRLSIGKCPPLSKFRLRGQHGTTRIDNPCEALCIQVSPVPHATPRGTLHPGLVSIPSWLWKHPAKVQAWRYRGRALAITPLSLLIAMV